MRTHTLTSGTFVIDFEPMTTDDDVISRMRVTKSYEGGLDGVGRGEMLSVGTAVEGSTGYVAIEHIDGTLDGRRGTFVLQHSALMCRGQSSLVVTVVPDSGTDDLLGLQGTFSIENLGSEHRYTFDYGIDPS